MAAGVGWFTLLSLISGVLCAHEPGGLDLISSLIKVCVESAVEQINSEKMAGLHGHSDMMHASPHGHIHGHADSMGPMEGGHSHGHVRVLDDNARLIRRIQENFKKLTGVQPTAILKDETLLERWRTQVRPHCQYLAAPLTCDPSSRFRTADGTCNNLENPYWGSTMIPQTRLLPPEYGDGLDSPRTTSVQGRPLSSTRLISNTVHTSTGQTPVHSKRSTNMFMAYGQFLDHDILHTPVLKDNKGKDMKCCPLGNTDEHCFPIPVPLDDPMFRGWCMSFVRSAAMPLHNCDPGFRRQLNHPTSYIDGSVIYGSNREHMDELRLQKYGRMKITASGLLHNAPDSECMLSSPGHHCFQSGDGRRHVTPTLTSLHLLFVKEHNHVADTLRSLNPRWDDIRIFQEAKRIVAAELQHIAFSEYLPIVIGDRNMDMYGLYPNEHGYNTVYDPTVDASTTSAFGAAAFRFGHSEVPGVLAMMARNYSLVKAIPLHTQFNKPDMMFERHGAENLMRWMTNSYHDRNDRFLRDSVRNFLFLKDDGESFDLAAINIQRGRDHGLPPYNTWRKWCGLQPVLHFGEGVGGMVDHDPTARKLMSEVYSHPDDIDLYTGGLAEIRLDGASTGPTFACIIARQFRKYQAGDRYWYENDFSESRFTLGDIMTGVTCGAGDAHSSGTPDLAFGFCEAQLNELKKTTLASVLCRNTGIRWTQPAVFLATDETSNRKVLCELIPTTDLTLWKEHDEFHSFQSPISPIAGFLNPLQNPNSEKFKAALSRLLQTIRMHLKV